VGVPESENFDDSASFVESVENAVTVFENNDFAYSSHINIWRLTAGAGDGGITKRVFGFGQQVLEVFVPRSAWPRESQYSRIS
jgi:hypothetical protein